MKRVILNLSRLGTLAGLVAFSAQAADFYNLESILIQPKVIYGADNRQDIYQVNNPMFRQLAESTAALFENSSITLPTAANLPAKLQTMHYGTSMGLCSDEPFYNQPSGAFCSGSLVGPDMMMTAGHCIRSQASCEDTSFVFGFAINAAEAYPSEAPTNDVYKCKEVVATYIDSYGADYALVKLDRVVNNHTPLKINRANDLVKGAPIVVIGHPSGLPTKVSDGANVRSLQRGYFQANLDTYGGNSGSAVFNTNTGNVEGILVRGETDYVYRNGCRVSNQCSDAGCRGEDVTNISALAHLIPQF